MGLVNGKLSLRNPRLPNLGPVEIVALADSGALHLCIPEQIQLKLEAIDNKEVALADGSKKLVPYVGRSSCASRIGSARFQRKTWI